MTHFLYKLSLKSSKCSAFFNVLEIKKCWFSKNDGPFVDIFNDFIIEKPTLLKLNPMFVFI